jgi:hypothetical protein
VYERVSGECKRVDSSTVGDWRRKQSLRITEGFGTKSIKSADETELFFTLAPNKTLSVKGSPCNEGKNSKERIMTMWADKFLPFTISYWGG